MRGRALSGEIMDPLEPSSEEEKEKDGAQGFVFAYASQRSHMRKLVESFLCEPVKSRADMRKAAYALEAMRVA